jgi:hypothetical protein
MTDPKPLLEDAQAGLFQRTLLESATLPGPTDAQVESLWSALATRLPAGGAPDGAPSGAEGTTAAASGKAGLIALAKALALVAFAGAAIVGAVMKPPRAGGSIETAPIAPTRSLAAEVSNSPAIEAAPAVVNALATTATPAALPESVAPAPRVATKGRPAERAAPLHAETELVLRARRALRAGDCIVALDVLEETRRRFATGALDEEREALAIESLDCAGRHAEAAARAAAFLDAYPASLQRPAMRRVADGDMRLESAPGPRR